MDIFLNFLKDNYIWFLVVTIVLLFSLIGYLVESSKYETDEDKEKKAQAKKEAKAKKEQERLEKEKRKNEKQKKTKKKRDEVEDILDTTPTVEEAMQQQNNENIEVLSSSEKPIETINGYDMPLIKEENKQEKI